MTAPFDSRWRLLYARKVSLCGCWKRAGYVPVTRLRSSSPESGILRMFYHAEKIKNFKKEQEGDCE